MTNKRGVNEVLSFIISVIIVGVIVVIVVYILLVGTGTIKSVGANTGAYVSQTEAATTNGLSILTGGTVNLDNQQFLMQFYGSKQCISLLNQLSLHSVLQSPTNPSSLSNTFFVCIGSYNNFTFYPNGPSTTNTRQSSWQSVTSWGNPAAPLWYNTGFGPLAGMNGSEGTVTFINTTGALATTTTLESYLNQSCINFLNATVSVSGNALPNEPYAYITSMNCEPIEDNALTYFISVEAPLCGTDPQLCSGNPLLMIHGSPAYITSQICRYYNGPSIICTIGLR